jgi:hypothetical protein
MTNLTDKLDEGFVPSGSLRQEQISVLEDKCFGDAASDGMNLWDEIRVFFASNGVARSSEHGPCLVIIHVKR